MMSLYRATRVLSSPSWLQYVLCDAPENIKLRIVEAFPGRVFRKSDEVGLMMASMVDVLMDSCTTSTKAGFCKTWRA